MLRHKNLPDKEIWDELKYALQNPMSEKEQTQRKKAETKFWNNILNKRFAQRKVNGVMTGAASGIDPNAAYRIINEDTSLTPEERQQRILEASAANQKAINKENFWRQAKLYGGATITLASAAIPGGGVLGAKAVGAVAKPLAQLAGRKMAELTANTVMRGAAVGAVEGFGRGMMNNENPLKTAAEDAVTGMALGGLTGAGAAGVEKVYNKVKMNNYAKKNKLW